MDMLTLQNPVFATYVIAATLVILKGVAMSWLTVVRMMQVKGGFRSPEDMRKTALNPEPNPQQLKPNDYVDRIRAWRAGERPVVGPDPRFALETVLQTWREVLAQ